MIRSERIRKHGTLVMEKRALKLKKSYALVEAGWLKPRDIALEAKVPVTDDYVLKRLHKLG